MQQQLIPANPSPLEAQMMVALMGGPISARVDTVLSAISHQMVIRSVVSKKRVMMVGGHKEQYCRVDHQTSAIKCDQLTGANASVFIVEMVDDTMHFKLQDDKRRDRHCGEDSQKHLVCSLGGKRARTSHFLTQPISTSDSDDSGEHREWLRIKGAVLGLYCSDHLDRITCTSDNPGFYERFALVEALDEERHVAKWSSSVDCASSAAPFIQLLHAYNSDLRTQLTQLQQLAFDANANVSIIVMQTASYSREETPEDTPPGVMEYQMSYCLGCKLKPRCEVVDTQSHDMNPTYRALVHALSEFDRLTVQSQIDLSADRSGVMLDLNLTAALHAIHQSSTTMWAFTRFEGQAPPVQPVLPPKLSRADRVLSDEIMIAKEFETAETVTPSAAADCSQRDESIMNRALINSTIEESTATAKLCAMNRGKKGYLELCCSLHTYETSGYGNQLLQLTNAFRFARINSCGVLCLPDCSGDKFRSIPCGGNSMWHAGADAHIVKALNLATSLKVPPEMPHRNTSERTSINSNYLSTTCLDGARDGLKRAGGYPYCFYDALQWSQAKSDFQHILSENALKPLPDSEVVMHMRSGDAINNINNWLKSDATDKTFDENQNIVGAVIQPGCKYYVDVALTGFDKKTFTKVHIITDMQCPEGSALEDGKCVTTNPCVDAVVRALPAGAVVLPTAVSPQEAFIRDVQLMQQARNIAVACSTFSLLGRLTAVHLRRLFVPNCQLTFQFTPEAFRFGRRRQKALERGGLTDGLPEFHDIAYSFLPQKGATAGQAFSHNEPNLTVSWYNFQWQHSAIIAAALGIKALSLDEWRTVTNSPDGFAPPRLLANVDISKSVYLPQAVQLSASSIRPSYGILRRKWLNRNLHSEAAQVFARKQADCGGYQLRLLMPRSGLGSALHSWSQIMYNAHERGANVLMKGAWKWEYKQLCSDSEPYSPLSCYFPGAQPCPLRNHQPLVVEMPSPIWQNPEKLHLEQGEKLIQPRRTAAMEYLFSHVNPVLVELVELTAAELFGPLGTPDQMITVHIRWSNKGREMDLVPMDEYIQAVHKIVHKHSISKPAILVISEDLIAVQDFMKAKENLHLSEQDEWRVFRHQSMTGPPTAPSSADKAASQNHKEESFTTFGKDETRAQGLVSLVNLLLGLESQYYVLTTGSNWRRLFNELRISIVDVDCGGCTEMIDLRHTWSNDW